MLSSPRYGEHQARYWLDAVRYGWAPMGPAWIAVGLVLLLPGSALFICAMAANAFFEGTVRIQHDRGHRVVDTGPYALVRHPGYIGFGAFAAGTSFVLGSWWSLLPAAGAILLLVGRTALEDRTLQRELQGYAEYTGRVRYRLVPGIW